MPATTAEIALVSYGLGIGGTDKGLVELALELDPVRFRPRVVSVLESGPRQAQLEAAGIEVAIAHGDVVRLAEALRGADVAHVFRAGNHEATVPAAVRSAGVPHLIESNIFGNVDVSPDRDDFAMHLFGSRMTVMRYRDRLGEAGADFDVRHRVLPFPVGLEALRAAALEPAEAKRRLGLDPARPVVGRVGRAADLKWRSLLVDMVPHLVELVPDVQMLVVGVTPAKRRALERLGVADRCTFLDPSPDLDQLAACYCACDVFVSAAVIGESQGMAINEALGLGVPVVTCSTPWIDNAQVEYVDHGRTGWIASHPRSFAEACADLLHDPDRRAAFGEAAARDMADRLSTAALTRRLESAYASLHEHGTPPVEWDPDGADLDRFAAEYPRRASSEYRPLRMTERAQTKVARARERAELVGDAVRTRAGERLPGVDAWARSEARGGWRSTAMRAYLGGHRLAQRAGLHVVRASYDSPIPRPEDLAGTFDRSSPMRGVAWDPEAQTAFLETELAPLIAEFAPTDAPAPEGVFRLGNKTYDRVDAELLYGLIRWSRPRRVVELGSGYSTLVAAEALERNGGGELHCFDPYPSPHVLARPELAARVTRTSAQQLDEAVVERLEAGDVLFVDTSHTVKQGGDVNRIVLDLLPLLAPGVLVHFHDIFLPRDYSPGHVANAHYWTEQYLLQAFLVDNDRWEVLIGGQAVVQHAPDRVAAVIPSYRRGVSPGAFWLRRRA